jgi:hypothetical protein
MAEVSVPVPSGANVTVIVQLPPAATPVPQLLVWLNPKYPMINCTISSGPMPVFESVTVCGALVVPMFCWPNVRLDGERLTMGAGTPVPVKLTVCGLPAALSVIVSDAPRDPAADGVNVTLITQFVSAKTLLPHVFVCVKSPALAPLMAILDMLSDAFPMLASTTYCAALGEPVPCWPKVRLL